MSAPQAPTPPLTDETALLPDPETMDYQERDLHYGRVTDAYLAGRVSMETFREARRRYGPDFRAIVRALAERKVQRRARP